MPDIIITNSSGQQWSFKDQEHPRIKIGRDTGWADIPLPENWRTEGVGREHCELVASAGCFSLEMNDRNRVWIDNKPAYDGDILPKKCTLSVLPSNPDAKFHIEYVFDGNGETVYYATPEKRETQLFKKLLLSVAVIALVVFSVWQWWLTSDTLSASDITTIESSIFTVQTQINNKTSHAGTAWLAAPNMVVTNRHVAELIAENLNWQKQGVETSAFIRLRSKNNQEGERVAISSVVYHPGADLWQAYLNEHTVRYLTEQTLKLNVYDIAILKLEKPLDLPALELASDNFVLQLTLSDELMIKGYPLNSGETSWDILRPVPETKVGTFDRLRNVFVTEGDIESNPILSYNIETRGGNSGSPVLSMSGKVVGIHFASDKKLVSSQALGDSKNNSNNRGVLVDAWKSYGQHVRLIRQLTSGEAFQSDFLNSERNIWNKWLNSVPSLPEYKIKQIQQKTALPFSCYKEFKGSWLDFDEVTPRIRRKDNWRIPIPKAKKVYAFVQSFAPTGDRIYVNAHTATQSFNLYQNQHYFDFESDLPGTVSELDLTLGGPNLDATWMVKLYTWSDIQCDQYGFELVKS
ncbi:MAG: trypsin-like peptidase domain-containing protein [Gammaproteobacteria bacterium]|nr:trypsin-like peptidase domain-containing protein [Gammaproteobacteria bacterium]